MKKNEIPYEYEMNTKTAQKHYLKLVNQARNRSSRKSAIRAFCLHCFGGIASEVRECPSTMCPLYKYRLEG